MSLFGLHLHTDGGDEGHDDDGGDGVRHEDTHNEDATHLWKAREAEELRVCVCAEVWRERGRGKGRQGEGER